MRRIRIFATAMILGSVGRLCGASELVRAQSKTIRFIPQSEATIFAPVVSVIAVTQQHAYMIYDTLFSLDERGTPPD